jgi:hypothetical protein
LNKDTAVTGSAPTDQESATYDAIARQMLTVLKAAVLGTTAQKEDDVVNIAILRAVTGKPWVQTQLADGRLDRSVTYDQYGPGALGNPVCRFPDYTRSTDACLELISAYPDTRLTMAQGDDGTWVARVLGPDVDVEGPRADELHDAVLLAILTFFGRVDCAKIRAILECIDLMLGKPAYEHR